MIKNEPIHLHDSRNDFKRIVLGKRSQTLNLHCYGSNLCDFMERISLLYGEKSNQNWPVSARRELATQQHEELCGVMEMFYILIMVVMTQSIIFQYSSSYNLKGVNKSSKFCFLHS
jgi:hypothetical protein